jgi:MFS family permease
LTWVIAGLSVGLAVAGLISPFVGHRIHDLGGRPILISSAFLLATGFTILALAPSSPVFVAGWTVMGRGMGTGLYDAAFSTLGRLYGLAARRHITTLTLFGGFASTICWPLSAFFLGKFGWRGTCVAYAAIQLLVALPIYLIALKGAVPPLAKFDRPGGRPFDRRPSHRWNRRGGNAGSRHPGCTVECGVGRWAILLVSLARRRQAELPM